MICDDGCITDIRIGRTSNEALIRSVIEHPEILPKIWDRQERIVCPIHESIYHLAAFDVGLIGIATFMPVNSITWNPHLNMLKKGEGTKVMQLAMDWMRKNTPCKKFIAFPPVYNRPMVRVFEKCGFNVEGYSPKSFEFNGVIHDRLVMGV